ncbi:hypothetical protein BZA77DRAFT_391344 [Pyronema omphalodes]|nr:hypothetical protein BZA77DRAFT_391344 [Pyronema omphalodes]
MARNSNDKSRSELDANDTSLDRLTPSPRAFDSIWSPASRSHLMRPSEITTQGPPPYSATNPDFQEHVSVTSDELHKEPGMLSHRLEASKIGSSNVSSDSEVEGKSGSEWEVVTPSTENGNSNPLAKATFKAAAEIVMEINKQHKLEPHPDDDLIQLRPEVREELERLLALVGEGLRGLWGLLAGQETPRDMASVIVAGLEAVRVRVADWKAGRAGPASAEVTDDDEKEEKVSDEKTEVQEEK